MANFTWKRASEDDKIFRQGFRLSSPNYAQELKRLQEKSVQNTDRPKTTSLQSIRADSDNKPILNGQSSVSNPNFKSNVTKTEKTSKLNNNFSWLKLLVKVFSDKFFKK